MDMKKIIFFTFLAATLLFAGSASAQDQTIVSSAYVRNALDSARVNTPLSFSMPIAKEKQVKNIQNIRLLKEGTEVPAQLEVVARHGGAPSDASKPISYIHVDALVNMAPGEKAKFDLQFGTKKFVESKLRITKNDASGITVNTGVAEFEMSKQTFRLFDLVSIYDGTLSNRVYYTDENSKNYGIMVNGVHYAPQADIQVHQFGPNKISLVATGWIKGDLHFTARMQFYKNSALVKTDFRLENRGRSASAQPHSSDYGTLGSERFDDLTLSFIGQGINRYAIPNYTGDSQSIVKGIYQNTAVLYQDGSGNPEFQNINSSARLQSGTRERQSSIQIDQLKVRGGDQMEGWFDASNITVVVEDGWQNYPKALRGKNNRLEVGLFPGEFSNSFELREGEYKTHSFWLRYHTDVAQDVEEVAQSLMHPLRFDAQSNHYPLLTGTFWQNFAFYETAIESQIVTADGHASRVASAKNIFDDIKKNNLYGLVDYGDLPMHGVDGHLPSNLPGGVLAGMQRQSMRALEDSQKDMWYELTRAGVKHSADVDVHHTQIQGRYAQRNWYEGGLYDFTNKDAGSNNVHRGHMGTSLAQAGKVLAILTYAKQTNDPLLEQTAREILDNVYYRVTHLAYPENASLAQTLLLKQCQGEACQSNVTIGMNADTAGAINALVAGYEILGDREYLTLAQRMVEYLWTQNASGAFGNSCAESLGQAQAITAVGNYYRASKDHAIIVDQKAIDLVLSRVAQLQSNVYGAGQNQFYTCDAAGTQREVNNASVLAYADAFAARAYMAGNADFMSSARAAFEYGSKNLAYEGSPTQYLSVKEFEQLVGNGHMYLFAHNILLAGDSKDPDNAPPIIANIRETNITTGQARIIWETTEPATSNVFYGLTRDTMTMQIGSGALSVNHGIILPNLMRDKTYYYQIESKDVDGNTRRSQIGSFRTLNNSRFVFYSFDNDNDGFTVEVDCDDNNAGINPGGTEILGNGIDDDCNKDTTDTGNNRIVQFEAENMPNLVANVSERLDNSIALYSNGYVEQSIQLLPGEYSFEVAARGDVFQGLNATMKLSIDGRVIGTFDVNSASFKRYRATTKLSGGLHVVRMEFTNDVYDPPIDNNLYIDKMIVILEDLDQLQDADGDGSLAQFDCNDNDASVKPGGVEVYYDGKDNDCDSTTKDNDQDNDGYAVPVDCNDTNANVHPGAKEINGDNLDNDCNSATGDLTWNYRALDIQGIGLQRNIAYTGLNHTTQAYVMFTPAQIGCYNMIVNAKTTNDVFASQLQIGLGRDQVYSVGDFVSARHITSRNFRDYTYVQCFDEVKEYKLMLTSKELTALQQIARITITSYELSRDVTAPTFEKLAFEGERLIIRTSEPAKVALELNGQKYVMSDLLKTNRSWKVTGMESGKQYQFEVTLTDAFGNTGQQTITVLAP